MDQRKTSNKVRFVGIEIMFESRLGILFPNLLSIVAGKYDQWQRYAGYDKDYADYW